MEEDDEPWSNFSKRLKACKQNLLAWHKMTFKNASKEINRLRTQLEKLISVEISDSDLEKIKALK